MYSQLLLWPLWSALFALRSSEAATSSTCDKCNFDGTDAEDCRVYGQLGDGNLIGWHRAAQACLDVFDIKDEAIDPDSLSSMFPNPDGTGGSPSSFVNYLRFEDGSVASGIKAGFPQFFVESATVPGRVELRASITVDGTSYDCSSSASSCWTAIRSYFSAEPGATEMAGVGKSLYGPRHLINVNASIESHGSPIGNQAPTSNETVGGNKNELSILTWNVWFGDRRQSDRYASIVSKILSLYPDVACFQEVNRSFLFTLKSSSQITERYNISSNYIYDYGILSIVKKDLGGTFVEIELPTSMGRNLLVTKFSLSDKEKDVAVGNVHLESLDNEPTRQEQLAMSSEYLSSEYHPNSILAGDFNFDSNQTWGDWNKSRSCHRPPEKLENTVLEKVMPNWADAWPYLKGVGDEAELGITFDGMTNPVCVREKLERMRYDRIMINNLREKNVEDNTKKMKLVPENIEMVGTEAIDETGLKASDHYGLVIRLKIIP